MEVEDFHSNHSNGDITNNNNNNNNNNLNVEDKKRSRSMKNDEIVIGGGSSSRFGRQWQNSSRIIRVSRASGGKDRHSKVWTAKGARDRRVRLSVNTAIQFYDLQDRLGYDQPSKAVEWLIKAAQDSINELPSLDSSSFPPDDTTGSIMMLQGETFVTTTTTTDNKTKSGCSSNNSENSKGDCNNVNSNNGLSLSRNEIRVKARERARERTAKEKDGGGGGSGEVTLAARVSSSHVGSSSFTQLLTAGINDVKTSNGNNNTRCTMSSSMSDYFGNGPLPNVMALLPFSGSSHEIHQHHQQQHHQQQHQQQQLAFLVDNHQSLIHVPSATTSVSTTNNSDYNLNFSMSSNSTTSGFNRGTLQSNSSSSPSFLSYLQRFSANEGGASSVPFFLGGAPIVENHHQQHQHYDHHHHQQFNPAGLHLSYGDGGRHSDDKGKGKN